ncbi:hypothetical protein NDK47_10950 [Brevibacillus ruminantium]|uniref:Uncharacterized protein n=1 Tax=Brevibacillus ruminantium TaxID=2950604 RepID=A0ABY4WLV9_9BACL|nr:hypothetical protein [Brevibacillus ruminantium]USG67756.1 hypothetical protein NDK47_10950 [Brevibacillus ruminantium]
MSRKELAKERLQGYIADVEQLLQEQKKDYPKIVQRAITNEINQLQKSIRHWDQVLQTQTSS